jgi:hypothetical protein
MGSSADRGELLSWFFYIGTGLGPFSGQAVHFQLRAPEKLTYPINRYRSEAERHYTVLDKHLEGRSFIVGSGYIIADISAWGWIDRASVVLAGSDNPLAPTRISSAGFTRSTIGRRPAGRERWNVATPSRKRSTKKRGGRCSLIRQPPLEVCGFRPGRCSAQANGEGVKVNGRTDGSYSLCPGQPRSATITPLTRCANSLTCCARLAWNPSPAAVR